MTPASTIIRIGLSFVLRSSSKQPAKSSSIVQFVSASVTGPPSQKAFTRSSTPADAIIATTAGRSVPRMPCRMDKLRYFSIESGNAGHQNTRGQNHTGCRGQRTGEPSKLCADKGRRVHRDRTGRHFRNGHKICKFLYAQPAVPGNKLLLKKRHRRVAAAEAEQADLQKTQKKLQCDHLRFLLRASSVRTIPSTIQQRIM